MVQRESLYLLLQEILNNFFKNGNFLSMEVPAADPCPSLLSAMLFGLLIGFWAALRQTCVPILQLMMAVLIPMLLVSNQHIKGTMVFPQNKSKCAQLEKFMSQHQLSQQHSKCWRRKTG